MTEVGGSSSQGAKTEIDRTYTGQEPRSEPDRTTSGTLDRIAPLLTAQSLGALNDNVLKTVVTLLLAGRAMGAGDGSFNLALTGAALVGPYLLFSGIAGFVSDRYRKRSVIVIAKAAELAVVATAIPILWLDRADLMIVWLFLMATQSAFFSPAKYGILPETFPRSELSHATGLIESTRYLAIIVGTATGGLLLAVPSYSLEAIGAVLIGIAVIGVIASLRIAKTSAVGMSPPTSLSPMHGLRSALTQRPIAFCVISITMLELLGCLVLLDLIVLTKTVMRMSDLHVGLLGTCLGLGAAAGSYICGRASGKGVRPIFSLAAMAGAALTVMILSVATEFAVLAVLILFVGLFGGAGVVPLYTMLQDQARSRERGQIIAANNFLNMVGVLIASAALWLLNDLAALSPRSTLLLSGMLLLFYACIAFLRWPEYGKGPILQVLSRVSGSLFKTR